MFQAEGTAVHGQWSAEETGRRSGGLEQSEPGEKG